LIASALSVRPRSGPVASSGCYQAVMIANADTQRGTLRNDNKAGHEDLNV
jgi:hypothetical protein